MKRKRLELTGVQRAELEAVRDQGAKSYQRERAAALLKVADGEVSYQVAQKGLLKKHDPHTLNTWINRYQAQGVAGLAILPGRGRKAAFFPSGRRSGAGRSRTGLAKRST